MVAPDRRPPRGGIDSPALKAPSPAEHMEVVRSIIVDLEAMDGFEAWLEQFKEELAQRGWTADR